MASKTFTRDERIAVGFLYAAGFEYLQMVKIDSDERRSYAAEFNDALEKMELTRPFLADQFPTPLTANSDFKELIRAAHKLTDHKTQWQLGQVLGNLERVVEQMKTSAGDVEKIYGKFPSTQAEAVAYADVLIETSLGALSRLGKHPNEVTRDDVSELLTASYLAPEL